MKIQAQKNDLAHDALVGLSNVGVQRNDRWLIKGIDLTIKRGEIVTLIGPNGSGKSTTAKLVLGLFKPTEGTRHAQQNIRVGYVPQKLQLEWGVPLTVRRLMCLTHKLSSEEIEASLEKTNAGHLVNESVSTLSGGEFQRVLLARAIAKKPQLLVLDEPVQGVDIAGETALYELIGSIKDEINCGVLLVSHDLHMVMASTDQVVCLNGHICCRGTPASVAESEQYRTLFGERAAATMAFYRHHHDHTHLDDGTVLHADGSISDTCLPTDEANSVSGAGNNA